MHLIITYLTPMFLATAGGDVQYARMAATEAVKGYRAREHVDLLYIAQIIAFGLAILDSLNRSMADNLSVTQVLRLRSNAASLSRAAERCQRVLRDAPLDTAASYYPSPEFDPEAERRSEEAVFADIAAAEQRLAEVTAPARTPQLAVHPNPAPHPQGPEPDAGNAASRSQRRAPHPGPNLPAAQKNPMTSAGPKQTLIPPDPIRTESPEEENERRTAWATAMIIAARRSTADLTKMPLAERRAAMLRASVLSEVAQKLLSGKPMPPSLLDSALRGRRPHR